MSELSRYAVPLMHSFRDAYENRDSRQEKVEWRAETRQSSDEEANADEGERVLSAAVRMRRRGFTETQIRQSVIDNLIDIVNTIDLQSAVEIKDLEYASRSVLNFGIYDLTHLTSDDSNLPMVEKNVTAAIINYEPRIRKETVHVRRDMEFNDTVQKLRLSIYAEVSYHPLDIPIEFVAEIDLSSGKVGIGKAVG
jgi:type VI secretion system protein ImpF